MNSSKSKRVHDPSDDEINERVERFNQILYRILQYQSVPEESACEFEKEIKSLGTIFEYPVLFNIRRPETNGVLSLPSDIIIFPGDHYEIPDYNAEKQKGIKAEERYLGDNRPFQKPLHKRLPEIFNAGRNIIRYNQPFLFPAADALIDLMEKKLTTAILSKMLAFHFNLADTHHPQLLCMITRKVYLSYTFRGRPTEEDIKNGISICSGRMDDIFHLASKNLEPGYVRYHPVFIKRNNYYKKMAGALPYKLPEEVSAIINQYSYDKAGSLTMDVLIKLMRVFQAEDPSFKPYNDVINSIAENVRYKNVPDKLSKIEITKNNNVLLTDYGIEIKLTPLQSALYQLLMNYPDGLDFRITDCQQEFNTILNTLTPDFGAYNQYLSTELFSKDQILLLQTIHEISDAFLRIMDDTVSWYFYIVEKPARYFRIMSLTLKSALPEGYANDAEVDVRNLSESDYRDSHMNEKYPD